MLVNSRTCTSFRNRARTRLTTTLALVLSWTIFSAVAEAFSRFAGLACSHSLHAYACVTTAVMGWLSSCAMDAAISAMLNERCRRARSSCAWTRFCCALCCC